jgi:hypothetical protein
VQTKRTDIGVARPSRGLFGAACLAVLGLTALLGGNAPSAGAEEACPNEAIREEQHSTYLPDCRAYELVSPQDKNGGEVALDSTRTRASASGDAVEFSSGNAFADPHGTGIVSEYISQRNGAPKTQGWSTHAISPNQEPGTLEEVANGNFEARYLGEFSPDLNAGVFLAKSNIGAGGDSVAGVYKLYLRDDLLNPGPGHYTLLSDCPACPEPLQTSNMFLQPAFAGASADFGHVIFESTLNLTAGAGGELPKLYEWDHGTLRLAGMVPPGTDTECGTVPLDPCESAVSSAAGQGADPAYQYDLRYTLNTISPDGSRILLTSPVGPHSEGTGQSNLYLGEDGNRTIQVNASERSVPEPPGPAQFWAATPDLSKIYFNSFTPLTDQGGGGLYVYDASKPASQHLTLLASGGITGVVGVSVHGDYVYLTAERQLAPGNPTSCDATYPCIFLWHQGTFRFVASIRSGQAGGARNFSGLEHFNGPASSKRARVSPDGTHLVFVSPGTPREQPPYQHGSCTGGGLAEAYPNSSGICPEVYFYDATAAGGEGTLTCVSCNATGTNTSGYDSDFHIRIAFDGPSSHLNHPLSDDGRFVFFDTGDTLLPQDTNGARDVYEYDSQTGGVSLISTGTSPQGSYFLDAGADGRDVFFATAQQLNGWDRDRQADLYDARIGGGLPEPAATALCEGDSCQGSQAQSPHPIAPSTGSPGIGNPPPHCPRGRLLRRRHCVRKPHKKNRQHRSPNQNHRSAR